MNKVPLTAEHGDPIQPRAVRRKSPGRRTLVVLVMLALLALIGMDGTRIVGRYMPFSVERNVAANYVAELPAPDAYSKALNVFAENIAAVQGLPPEIAVEVHVIRTAPVQAFPTLGGHILLYEGLLRALRSEDELTALLAHQIAHLRLRHPAEALGRRVSVGMMLSIFSQDLAEAFSRPSFHASLRTAPTFLEQHETATLKDTGDTLVARHGHLGGATDLSATLKRIMATDLEGETRIIATHPGIAQLDEALRRMSREHDWPVEHPARQRRPLPADLVLHATQTGADTSAGKKNFAPDAVNEPAPEPTTQSAPTPPR